MIEGVFDLVFGEAVLLCYLLVGVPVRIRTFALTLETDYVYFGVIDILASLDSWNLMMAYKAQYALLGHGIEFHDLGYGIVVVKIDLFNVLCKL